MTYLLLSISLLINLCFVIVYMYREHFIHEYIDNISPFCSIDEDQFKKNLRKHIHEKNSGYTSNFKLTNDDVEL